MIAVNEQNQRNERAQHGQVDNLISVDWKPVIVDGERIENSFPTTGDSE